MLADRLAHGRALERLQRAAKVAWHTSVATYLAERYGGNSAVGVSLETPFADGGEHHAQRLPTGCNV